MEFSSGFVHCSLPVIFGTIIKTRRKGKQIPPTITYGMGNNKVGVASCQSKGATDIMDAGKPGDQN